MRSIARSTRTLSWIVFQARRARPQLSVSPDPAWQPEIAAADQFIRPRGANQLDDAGYLDADGNGVREMPGGGDELKFRYAERSDSVNGAAIRELIEGWLKEIGIALEVSVFDDTQLGQVVYDGTYDLFVWGWTPFVDPDPMLSYFTCDQLTTDAASPGYNDANWCSPEYDEMCAQNQELDRATRVSIVQDMLRLFYEESTYVVLFEDPDLQAYRTDRFEGWTKQPAETGPVLFTNTSPTYVNLTPIGADAPATDGTSVIAPGPDADSSDTDSSDAADDGGLGAGAIVGIVAGVLVVLALVGGMVMRSRNRTATEPCARLRRQQVLGSLKLSRSWWW
jgi:peptide/nickel transport system substrate-binding protein